MSDSDLPSNELASSSRHDRTTALFATMVMQQANMAMLYLGQMPHPETGQPVRDLDAAQMFIDQLEMLEVKTRGNLNHDEAALLKQSLSSARMAFVQAVQGAGKPETPQTEPSTATPSDSPGQRQEANTESPSTASTPADDRKKF